MTDEQKPLDKSTFDRIMDLIEKEDESPEFKVAPEVAAAVAKFEEEHRDKSFSERHPELGKMMNCAICRSRHRSHIKCKQTFSVRYQEQEMQENGEWGPLTDVLAVAPRTRKGVNGAAGFKGRRLKPHLNHRSQLFIARVRKLFTYSEGAELTEAFKAALGIARKRAVRQLKKEYRIVANRKTRQQDISRRINRGLLRAGYQLEAR